jgi:hypothetical protein
MRAQWEYRIELFYNADGSVQPTPPTTEWLDRMNTLGAQGWELCPMSSGAGTVLKREIA